LAFIFRIVVSHKFLLAFLEDHPVAVFHGGGIACAGLLLVHLLVEPILIHGKSVLAANQFGKVKGEAVSVEQSERADTVKQRGSLRAELLHVAVEHLDALFQGAQEAVLLFFHHAADQLLLCRQLGIGLPHFLHENGDELEHERTSLVEERIGISHGPSQDASDDISRLGISGQLSVGNREGHGAQMVGDDTHGDVYFLLLVGSLAVGSRRCGETIALARVDLDFADDGLEDVGIVVRVLALQHAHQSLEAHAGVDDVHAERFERAVRLAVELHEHDVPYLDDLRIILVYQRTAGHQRFLLGRTRVYMDLRAGSARSRVAHFPEVVVLVAIDDMVFGQVLGPVFGSLVVAWNVLLGRAFEYGDIQVFGVEVQHLYEIFPRIVDGLLLEIVAKAPVAEHLKHGVVVGIVAHLLKIVVLTAHAQALLRVGTAPWLGVFGAKDDILPLVHTCICKHQRRVVLDHHRCRRNDDVSL